MPDNEFPLKIIPPHNLEAEQFVLGTFLKSKDVLAQTKEILVADLRSRKAFKGDVSENIRMRR